MQQRLWFEKLKIIPSWPFREQPIPALDPNIQLLHRGYLSLPRGPKPKLLIPPSIRLSDQKAQRYPCPSLPLPLTHQPSPHLVPHTPSLMGPWVSCLAPTPPAGPCGVCTCRYHASLLQPGPPPSLGQRAVPKHLYKGCGQRTASHLLSTVPTDGSGVSECVASGGVAVLALGGNRGQDNFALCREAWGSAGDGGRVMEERMAG